MASKASRKRCAIYTRKSTEDGLEQDFNSLDAQREACSAYILSQAGEGWEQVDDLFDDGGWSGGSMERPGLQQLLDDVRSGKVDVIVVYKVDRLTRSLADFAKIVEVLDDNEASFVSVTQAFNTTTSMGRLTLNVLLSFAQFEREVTSERIRDKVAASKKKGMWMGGAIPFGFRLEDRKLVECQCEAKDVRHIFKRYLELKSIPALEADLAEAGIRTRVREFTSGRTVGGIQFMRGPLALMLKNPIYAGKVRHKGAVYDGEHNGLISEEQFEAVQRTLSANNRRHSIGRNSKAPSLLSGLLTDPEGRPMSPARGQRGSKIYCYYVTRDRKCEVDACPWRLPAGPIDSMVLRAVAQWLSRPSSVEQAGRDQWQDALNIRMSIKTRIETGSAADKREVLLDLSCSVRLQRDYLAITLALPGDVDSIELKIQSKIVRRGHEVKLVDVSGATPCKADPVLLRLVAQAFAARKHLIDQEPQPLVENLSKRHLARLARLSLLAPDIIQAIVEGRQPPHLAGRQLLRRGDIPLAWDKQRKLLGFS